MTARRIYLGGDWYGYGLPGNVQLGENVYLDSAYGFAHVHSEHTAAIRLGDGCSVSERASFLVGPAGRIEIGSHSRLVGAILVCNQRIVLGSGCLLQPGAVVADTWLEKTSMLAQQRNALRCAAGDPLRRLPPVAPTRPVHIGDNAWIGESAVVMPGVTLGRGSVIMERAVVTQDVPPHAVVAGNPARVVRFVDPRDAEQARAEAVRSGSHEIPALLTGVG
jgi:acetyltransferase-like isoleucine patch superfamily enzyme